MELTKMDKAIIESRANKMLESYGFIDGEHTYVDVVQLANSVGFQVGETDRLSFYDDGFIVMSPDESKNAIVVNIERSLEDKRFIVAHELAHFVLHYDHDETTDVVMQRVHVKNKDSQENDADYFAACILMPKKSFLNVYNRASSGNQDSYSVCRYLQDVFRTSLESVERRIGELTNG